MFIINGYIDESNWDQFFSVQMLNGFVEFSIFGELEDSGLEEYWFFCCGDCGCIYCYVGSFINY